MAEQVLNIKTSTNVKAASWDPETLRITCVFNSGHSGYYSGCSLEVAEAFEQSESPGKFVASALKPQFSYTKIR